MKTRFVTLEEFRKVIKDKRKSLGYSLQGLGSRIGIDRNTVKLIEDGKIRNPGLSKALLFLTALGLDASALIAPGETDSNIPKIIMLLKKEPLLSSAQKEKIIKFFEKQLEKSSNRIVRILIVDDQEIFVKGLMAMLHKKEYVLETAQNYDNAIIKITSFQPDLLLLDIDLKEEKTGVDIVKYLVAKELDIPCVMLSGLRNQTLGQEALSLGAFDYVDKEEDMNKIFFIIKKIEEFKRLKDEYGGVDLEGIA